MDEVYASLAYDGAPLLCIPVCVSRDLLVKFAATRRNFNNYIIFFLFDLSN